MSYLLNEVTKIVRSFRFAFRGIVNAFRSDHSFRLEVLLGTPVFSGIAWFLRPMTTVEVILLWSAFLIILSVELLNTSIERLLDRLHPEEHELIAVAKDISAAAVLVAFLLAGLVVLLLCWSRIGPAAMMVVSAPYA
jgi:diacylglycerol kinase (ATP)